MNWKKQAKVIGIGMAILILGLFTENTSMLLLLSVLSYLIMAVFGKLRYKLTNKEIYLASITMVLFVWLFVIILLLIITQEIPDLIGIFGVVIAGIIGSIIFTKVGIWIAGLLAPTPNPNT